jgi:peptide/nickel transport system ATP-binding protein
MTIGNQIVDAIQAHRPTKRTLARNRAMELLETVGLDPKRVDSYSHQLSGGMRQRAIIAIALALNPKLIIMDEPTTALDVVVQRQIIEEIQHLREQFGFSVLFITHDLSLLVEFSDRIAIMYAGEIVEIGASRHIFEVPQHPYTVRLMRSFPTLYGERSPLLGIPGSPPDLVMPPSGCRFHPRCDLAQIGLCEQVRPQLKVVTDAQRAACHLVPEKRAL